MTTNLRIAILGNYTAHAINVVIPMTMVPVLISSIGIEGFGRFSAFQAGTMLFAGVVDWGFQLSLSRNGNNEGQKPKEIDVMKMRLIVASVFTLPFYLLFAHICGLSVQSSAMAIVGGIAVGLSAAHRFWSTGRYIQYAMSELTSKLIWLILGAATAALSNNESLLEWFYVLSLCLGLLSQFLFLRQDPTAATNKLEDRNTTQLFRGIWGNAPIAGYVTSGNVFSSVNPLILSAILPSAELGFYSACERGMKAIRGLYKPMSQILYSTPVVAQNSISKIPPALTIALGFSVVICLSYAVFGHWAMRLAVDESYIERLYLFAPILVFVICLSVISNYYSFTELLRAGHDKLVMSGTFALALLNSFLLSYLSSSYGITGALACLLIVETAGLAVWFTLFNLFHDPKKSQ